MKSKEKLFMFIGLKFIEKLVLPHLSPVIKEMIERDRDDKILSAEILEKK